MTVPATAPAEHQIAQKIVQQIAGEIGVRAEQVGAAVELLDGGATVPSSPATAALDGARAILVERFGEDADLIGSLREEMWSVGRLVSRVRDGKQEAGAKFSDEPPNEQGRRSCS